MTFGSLDGDADGEYNGIDVGKISKISAMQDTFFSLERRHFAEIWTFMK